MKAFLIIISCIFFFSCKSKFRENKNQYLYLDSVISQKGVIIYSNLKSDVFFPFEDENSLDTLDYLNNKFSVGFLLTHISPNIRWDLIHKFADTLNDNFNYPLTHFLPITVTYHKPKILDAYSEDTLCFKWKDSIRCLNYVVVPRFFKELVPLKDNSQ